ncbi:MAG: YicC/YloC family endoribonuclease [Bradymonadia bacterium]
MTGFGRSEAQMGQSRYTVELRALNHRYLELRLKVPKRFSPHEHFIRQRLSKALRRGRIDVSIQPIDGESDTQAAVHVNEALLKAIVEGHTRIAEITGARLDLNTRMLAQTPGVLTAVEEQVSEEAQRQIIGEALDAAVAALKTMRATEGATLQTVLLGHLERMEQLTAAVNARAPELSEAYRKRLEGRLNDALERIGAQADPGRVIHEVALFAEKIDVAEEIARLGSHVTQARQLIRTGSKGKDGIGRRMDFLFQEMNREVNTIGSKIQDVEISQHVVDLKVELERLREQVQNVE